MSSWTMDEVRALELRGGNNRCRQSWLKHAPPIGQQGRPAA
eukprot:CAMPEP_0118710300 /NCGR_PEP_ID=MMETSP0800-20121206/23269_1 /TAXON_ID=210618 ORGANISM="Striatella unipunctata, Strain CCMP2910" /NCGR_SAMPLE_ID=MMETSP0800 /ASSEMBLY_ACC=CAM_ASM_000638 /LENGTH=40 /DNA_ID= /DNA_START= /DNA_END= /DNA_ORIENTATION=